MICTKHLLVSVAILLVGGLLVLLFVGVRSISTEPSEREEVLFGTTKDAYEVAPNTYGTDTNERNSFIEKVRTAIEDEGLPEYGEGQVSDEVIPPDEEEMPEQVVADPYQVPEVIPVLVIDPPPATSTPVYATTTITQ
jgi:hypothetical protein